MAFLLLNCTRKSESGSTYKSEQYTASLREQYEILQHKYAGLKSAGFETFVQTCCNAALPKRYFLSMPDILRGGVNGDYYNNIVLRPESDPAMSAILPQNVDVIFIGDINMRYGEFVVKGFEVLDKNVHKYGEKEISGVARCAFTTKVLPSNAAVPNYGFQLEPGASLFTRDVILELTTENYPVPVPADLINIYEQWKEYIEFRKYYLEQLGNDRIPVAGCDTVSAFALKKSLYDKNREKYQAYLLDDLAEFEKNDMVLLEKEVDEAESFPLVRVIVEKNRKELFSAMSLRRKDKPAFEMRLNRFTREAVALAGEAPSGRNGKPALEFLDERYRLYHKDIEPDYSDINEQEQAEISAQYRRIDQRYNNEIAVQSAGKKREESARIDAENDKKKDAFKEKDGKKKKGDNGKEYAEFIKKLEADKERVLEETITQFEKTLYSQCEPRIKEEKQRIQSEIQKKYAPAREAKKENETLRRYYIYFKIPGDEKELQKRITALKPISLVYDQRAEKAKIKRQETSLNNFFKGYVK
jgi:hypothetical protein